MLYQTLTNEAPTRAAFPLKAGTNASFAELLALRFQGMLLLSLHRLGRQLAHQRRVLEPRVLAAHRILDRLLERMGPFPFVARPRLLPGREPIEAPEDL